MDVEMTPKESPNPTACQKFQDDHDASMSWQSHVRNTMDDPDVSSLIDELEKHDHISDEDFVCRCCLTTLYPSN